MLDKELIQSFLSQPIIAVVGVSRKKDLPANHIYKKFKSAGYDVYQVNPNAKEIAGDLCYASLKELPIAPSAVMMACTPDATFQTIDDCIDLNVSIIWMHRGIGQGSFDQDASDKARENGISVIENGCPMMFVEPVDWFHGMLKWFK